MTKVKSGSIFGMGRHVARSMLKCNYGVYHSYRLARAWRPTRALLRHNPILVFQMGKVGSTAVHASLERSFPDRSVLHFHTLAPASLAEQDRQAKHIFSTNVGINPYHIRAHHVNRFLGRLAESSSPVDVVTLVREPIARDISAYFEWLEVRQPDLDRRIRSFGATAGILDEVREDFIGLPDGMQGMNWFAREFEPVTGIDVFASSFDRDAGFDVIQRGAFRALILRYENLSENFVEASSEFFGSQVQPLPTRNVSSGKYYGDVFREITRKPALPSIYIDSRLCSSTVSHFYLKSEIEAFRSKWMSASRVGSEFTTP